MVDDATLEWLAGRRFGGRVTAYREGELYAAGSPVLTVEGRLGEAVLLETIVLSILNHDSAVAGRGRAHRRSAAGGRPVIEMGSRRTDPEAAVAAARAAYIAGFASTSNLEAGRRYGSPDRGHRGPRLRAGLRQRAGGLRRPGASLGPGTTLLVDTYDTEQGIRHAVAAAGPGLGAIRIDSGDLAAEAVRARRLLDELGATGTRIVVTGDLDDQSHRAPWPRPGRRLRRGHQRRHRARGAHRRLRLQAGGHVGAGGARRRQRPVAKRSPGKATVGGRKWAWRLLERRPGRGRGGGHRSRAAGRPVPAAAGRGDGRRRGPAPAGVGRRPGLSPDGRPSSARAPGLVHLRAGSEAEPPVRADRLQAIGRGEVSGPVSTRLRGGPPTARHPVGRARRGRRAVIALVGLIPNLSAGATVPSLPALTAPQLLAKARRVPTASAFSGTRRADRQPRASPTSSSLAGLGGSSSVAGLQPR